MASKVYTKTGDGGVTSLGMQRLSKTHPVFDVIGELDSIISQIGLLLSFLNDEKFENISKGLKNIQYYLYELGGYFHKNYDGNYQETQGLLSKVWGYIFQTIDDVKCEEIDNTMEKWLEKEMNTMSLSLPKLSNFIRPGGDSIVSQIHICRTFARDLERSLHRLDVSMEQQKKDINRLSDWFFVLARYYHYTFCPETPEDIFG